MDALSESFSTFISEYGGYITDIRRRLLFTTAFFCTVLFWGFYFSPAIIREIIRVLDIHAIIFVATSPLQIISLSFDIGLFIAMVTTFPLVLLQMGGFVFSALTKRERITIVSYLCMAILLFVVGFAYGVVVMYYASIVASSFNATLGLQNFWDIGSFVPFVLITSALLGLIFQFPLMLHACMRFGVFDKKLLARNRRWFILVIVVIVALLPPTDGLSLVVMTVPLIALYEITILMPTGSGRSARTLSV